ncbi:MAG TPA: lipoyl synthase [Acidimicrobiales bacterium]|nr:lipoyl synthase [Acidimicrobiales bacterium]
MTRPFRVRWLGRVGYREAHALMTGMWAHDRGRALLLLEHPPTYTLGVRADLTHVLVPPASVGAELVRTDRGGDVTFHGPGQLVGYPIVDVALGTNAIPNHVHAIEQVVIDALADVGLPGAGRYEGYPGVWVGIDDGAPRKIAAVGVRVSKGRSMHGFALNVDVDLDWFDNIVPCGISEFRVTSLAAEGVAATMRDVVEAVAARAAAQWGTDVDRADVAWAHRPEDLSVFSRAHAEGHGTAAPGRALGRLAAAGVDTSTAVTLSARKPEWLRAKADFGPEYRSLKKTMRSLDLVTVCEEAGCPNISECWADGTATFMINGERCTRACGFCLVDTRKPEPPSVDEPERVAAAIAKLGLRHAVVTTVARDDLADGGAAGFAATIAAVRATSPATAVEVLISDCKGDAESLDLIFRAQPDVLNHNLETVARLQRAVRPSAGYARSLAVLARAKAAGLTTKSGIMVGLGESHDEVIGALRDLRSVGVDIVTVGQYLRPTEQHLPVARWWTPEEFAALKAEADNLGFAHVECSPLTRSSYHARAAADMAQGTPLAASGSFS